MKKIIRPFETITEMTKWRALHQPDKLAYTFLTYLNGEKPAENSLTYKEVDLKARNIAAVLQKYEAKGERALLIYPPGLDHVVAFFGCLYAGMIPVPTYPPVEPRLTARFEKIAADAQATFILTMSPIKMLIKAQFNGKKEITSLNWLATDSFENDSHQEFKDIDIQKDTIGLLQYTSGSTTAPKGVIVTHENLISNLSSPFREDEIRGDDVGVSWLPQYHDMGLIGGILQAFYIDTHFVFMSPMDFLQKPFRWLQALSMYKGTISGSPNFGYDQCVRTVTPEEKKTLDLSNWDCACNGAEPVRADTFERFSSTFAECGFNPNACRSGYGLAESTFLATGGRRAMPSAVKTFSSQGLRKNTVIETNDENDAKTLVGNGDILPGGRLLIVDPDTLQECPPDRVGEIWITSPSVTREYWNMKDETEEVFNAYLSDTGEGPFLRTGDLGFMFEGELYFSSRRSDLIRINGDVHYPHDIERTAEESHEALRTGCNTAFTMKENDEKKLVLVQEFKKNYSNGKVDLNDVSKSIQQFIAEKHDINVRKILFLKTGHILKTSSGKIRRMANRDLFIKDPMNIQEKWGRGYVGTVELNS